MIQTGRGFDNSSAAEQLLGELCKQAGITCDTIRYIMATGYSRKIFDVADDDISEITAHAYHLDNNLEGKHMKTGGL